MRKTGTLLGMSQQRLAAAKQARAQAKSVRSKAKSEGEEAEARSQLTIFGVQAKTESKEEKDCKNKTKEYIIQNHKMMTVKVIQ